MDSHLNPPLDRHGGIRPDRPWTGNPTRRADARRGFSSEAPLARRVSAALDFPSFASAPDPPQACGAGSWIRGRSSRTARMPRGGARFWALGPPCACSGGPSAREFPVRGLCVRARVGRDGDAGSTCGSRHGAPGRKVGLGHMARKPCGCLAVGSRSSARLYRSTEHPKWAIMHDSSLTLPSS